MAGETVASDTDQAMLFQDTHIPVRNGERRGRASPSVEATAEVPLTAMTRRALEDELARLRDERLREIPARLRIAREFGDTANNDEHLAIREEEAVLAARVARLEDVLRRAVVVDPVAAYDRVAIGSNVSAVDVETGETLEYLIDGAHGAGKPGTVSAISPVGRAMLGRRRGEHVSVELPNGRTRELKLRDIRASASS
jgi:transcription elongation factor GreA